MLHGEFEVSLEPHSKIPSLKYNKNITLTQYILLGFTCVSVLHACLCIMCVLVPMEAMSRHWILWNLEF